MARPMGFAGTRAATLAAAVFQLEVAAHSASRIREPEMCFFLRLSCDQRGVGGREEKRLVSLLLS